MAFFATRPDKSLVRELASHTGRGVDVIAHGSGPDASLLATRELLALRLLGEWRIFGWEEVTTGSWRAESLTFSWKTTTGEDFPVRLDDVGRLPELFQERVQASTVVTVSHDLARGRVQLIGRRKLDGSDEIRWYAVAGGGADLSDAPVAALVVAETDRLKAEYGV
ncbi:hypothetical protein [Tessaracoccus antarcticus]|uniref:Uncharacterized protein n=1 Tax=Tessaracoccus antarcticus TaxID=2479848 RepID=A0A3M0G559_9ACTN|nr:hypothetical protein [Tessaracoccus antarcticus]RMB59974.1 hypothetical protein EAX62_09630 [Tessaracoccus antarcticus]